LHIRRSAHPLFTRGPNRITTHCGTKKPLVSPSVFYHSKPQQLKYVRIRTVTSKVCRETENYSISVKLILLILLIGQTDHAHIVAIKAETKHERKLDTGFIFLHSDA